MIESCGVMAVLGPSARSGPHGLDRGTACTGWHGVNAAVRGQRVACGLHPARSYGAWESVGWAWESIARARFGLVGGWLAGLGDELMGPSP
jgi:hypothetical protein